MEFVLSMRDGEDGRKVEISQSGVEYLGDLNELLLTFVRACGYDFVGKIVIVSEDGSKEWVTE